MSCRSRRTSRLPASTGSCRRPKIGWIWPRKLVSGQEVGVLAGGQFDLFVEVTDFAGEFGIVARTPRSPVSAWAEVLSRVFGCRRFRRAAPVGTFVVGRYALMLADTSAPPR